ncbi:MAG: glycosyltransferase family 2 protein [Crocinitomicaceae bacterium]
MIENPLVSICVPTYNQVKYLEKCLISISIQTFKNFELIISDDSTTEEVFNLVHLFQSRTGLKVSYFRNIPSLGSPENWNYVISKANGKWIKIMHHDEWFSNSESLQKFVKKIEDKGESLIFSGIQGFNLKENKSYTNLPSKEFVDLINNDPFKLLKGNFIGPPSCIIFPKSILNFDNNIKWLVDIDFYIQLLKNFDFKLEYIEEILIENCIDEHNITNSYVHDMELQLVEYIYLLKKYSVKMNFKNRLLYLYCTYNFLKSFKQQNFIILLLRLLKKRFYV